MLLIQLLIFGVLKCTFGKTVSILKVDERRAAENLNDNLTQLLEVIRNQQNFESIIVLNLKLNSTKKCIFEEELREFLTTRFIFNSSFFEPQQNLQHYPKESLVLICADNITKLFEIFQTATYDQFFSLRHFIQLTGSDEVNITAFCEQAFSFDSFNILLTVSKNSDLFKCRKHPPNTRMYEKVQLQHQQKEELFENQFLDMYGSGIKILPDQLTARCILHMDATGNLKILGQFGKLVESFIERRNATRIIPFPIKMDHRLGEDEVLEKIKSNMVDIGVSVNSSPLSFLKAQFSYPYEIVSFCFMIPIPLHMPVNRIFFYIIEMRTLVVILLLIVVYGVLLLFSKDWNLKEMRVLNFLVNDESLRGMLGQSFSLAKFTKFNTRFICLQLCVASILISTMYQAFLSANFTQPALLPRVKNAEDAAAAGLKILIMGYEKFLMQNQTNSAYNTHREIFILANYSDFFRARDSMDTRYIYGVTSSRWRVYDLQQSYFKRKLFYNSNDFCIIKYIILGLPMRRRLPYQALFNDFILRIHSAGFYQLWLTEVFNDLLLKNHTIRKDLSEPEVFAIGLVIDDLYWLGCTYLGFTLACVFIFLIELFVDGYFKKLRTV